jgi:hypothetical protein
MPIDRGHRAYLFCIHPHLPDEWMEAVHLAAVDSSDFSRGANVVTVYIQFEKRVTSARIVQWLARSIVVLGWAGMIC